LRRETLRSESLFSGKAAQKIGGGARKRASNRAIKEFDQQLAGRDELPVLGLTRIGYGILLTRAFLMADHLHGRMYPRHDKPASY
jgi:hypothetical protein